MIVRELITKLGIDFDSRGADEAEKRVDGLSGMLKKFAIGALAFKGFSFLKDMVDASSDAEQTISKLDALFGDARRAKIVDWADGVKAATGESALSLRELAADFGGLLVPSLDDPEKAMEWSERLSQLSLDISALENKDPKEIVDRLISGLTGSSEAVERLGISIKQASLEEFARARGLNANIKQMKVREKMELIYQKILYDKRTADGAAAKEATSHAGAMRRLGGAWKDFMAKGGDQIRKWGTTIAITLTKTLGFFTDLISKTTMLRTAILAASAALIAWGIAWGIANWPLIVMGIGIALLLVALDELIGFMSGKKSVLGTFFKELDDGITMLFTRVDVLRKSVEALQSVVKGSWIEDLVRWGYEATPGNVNMTSADPRMRRNVANLRKRNMTNEERAKAEEEEKQKIRDDLGLSNPGAGLGLNFKPQLPGVKIPIRAPAGGGGTTVDQSVNVNLSGKQSPDTVREAERAAERLQRKQNRDLHRTTNRKR